MKNLIDRDPKRTAVHITNTSSEQILLYVSAAKEERPYFLNPGMENWEGETAQGCFSVSENQHGSLEYVTLSVH